MVTFSLVMMAMLHPTRAVRCFAVLQFVEELGKLQDRVPAFSADKAKAIIEADLGQPVSKLFRSFDDRPIAAASLGQVRHGWARRRLKTPYVPDCVPCESAAG
jgi:hypothetical protein